MFRFDNGNSPAGHKKVAKGLVILLVILLVGSTGYKQYAVNSKQHE